MADGQWLPSWNDSAAKSAILDFVARVTKQGGTEFVPPAGRIATFDNDGTLFKNRKSCFPLIGLKPTMHRVTPSSS